MKKMKKEQSASAEMEALGQLQLAGSRADAAAGKSEGGGWQGGKTEEQMEGAEEDSSAALSYGDSGISQLSSAEDAATVNASRHRVKAEPPSASAAATAAHWLQPGASFVSALSVEGADKSEVTSMLTDSDGGSLLLSPSPPLEGGGKATQQQPAADTPSRALPKRSLADMLGSSRSGNNSKCQGKQ